MTIYSIDVDELLPSEKVEILLNQDNKTLTIQFRNKPLNGTLKISSHLNQIIYSESIIDYIKTIQLDGFSKGIYSVEIMSDSYEVIKVFKII